MGIQACRGHDDIEVYDEEELTNVVQQNYDSAVELESDSKKIAAQGDFMRVNSTLKGFSAYRHKVLGSFFIQSLCHTMNDYGEYLDFESIVKRTAKVLND